MSDEAGRESHDRMTRDRLTLARNLKAKIDQELIEAYRGTESLKVMEIGQ